MKIGRNAPCPCGSGKKYKKCCLSREGAPRRPEAAAPRRPAPAAAPGWVVIEEDDPLDELAEEIDAHIEAGRFAEAEAGCRRLREEYPDAVDGWHLQAQLDEARGRRTEAARAYRECVAFARANEGFDEEGIAEWAERAEALEKGVDPAR